MINRFIEALIEDGFYNIKINTEGIHIFYRLQDNKMYIVAALEMWNGDEFTKEQYEHILEQVRDSFIKRGFNSPNILGILYTCNPEKVKQLCADEDTHWVVDLSTRSLIVYENQSSNFMGLKSLIEFTLDGFMDNPSIHNTGDKKTKANLHKIITPVNSIIIGINILIFLYVVLNDMFLNRSDILRQGALSWKLVYQDKQYYRVVSSMFLHSGFEHLFNNMLVLVFVGDNCERALGKLKYLTVYLGSGIIAGICSISYNMLKNNRIYSVGASGAIFGIVGAMIYILIVNKGQLEDISSRQIILFAVFSLYGGITNAGIDNVAHIGGFIAGLILSIIIYRKPLRKQEYKIHGH
jgi:rhomboid protease GluP